MKHSIWGNGADMNSGHAVQRVLEDTDYIWTNFKQTSHGYEMETVLVSLATHLRRDIDEGSSTYMLILLDHSVTINHGIFPECICDLGEGGHTAVLLIPFGQRMAAENHCFFLL